MNYYETLYIIHPALDAGRVKEMVLSVNDTLEKNGGSVASIDVWGKKKLAYEIDKQRYGTYVLVQFTGDGSGNGNFNVELEHNPNVLSYLTIKIEEHKISKQNLSLDEQISGDNPVPSKAEPKNQKPLKIDSDNSKNEESSSDEAVEESSSNETVEESSSDEAVEESSSDEVEESSSDDNKDGTEE